MNFPTKKSPRLSSVGLMCSCLAVATLLHGSLINAAQAEQDKLPLPAAVMPIASSVYADEIGNAVFEQRKLMQSSGYTVQSGNLSVNGDLAGAMVVVQAENGAITAIIESPEKRGLLLIDGQGNKTFIKDVVLDNATDDEVKETVASLVNAQHDSLLADKHYAVDVFVGMSVAAAGRVGNDPQAYALAQLEMVNLALRNSRVDNITLVLAGMKIVEQDYSINHTTWNNIVDKEFQASRQAVSADLVAVFYYGNLGGASNAVNGIASLGGKTSLQTTNSSTTFRHEVGHNSGISHCTDGSKPGYAWGYGDSAVCGDRVPYYSTPAVLDQNGKPRGIVDKADSARVWRDNAFRLSSYEPTPSGQRMILAGVNNKEVAKLTIPRSPGTRSGVVTLDSAVGPTELIDESSGPYTLLRARLINSAGAQRIVKLRGMRSIGGCGRGSINRSIACESGSSLFVTLEYHKDDNLGISQGVYNGVLKLKALDAVDAGWQEPITVSIAVSVN